MNEYDSYENHDLGCLCYRNHEVDNERIFFVPIQFYICINLVASEIIDTAHHCYIGNILPWTNQVVCFIKKSNYFHLDCITYFVYITLTFLIVRQLHVLDSANFKLILTQFRPILGSYIHMLTNPFRSWTASVSSSSASRRHGHPL